MLGIEKLSSKIVVPIHILKPVWKVSIFHILAKWDVFSNFNMLAKLNDVGPNSHCLDFYFPSYCDVVHLLINYLVVCFCDILPYTFVQFSIGFFVFLFQKFLIEFTYELLLFHFAIVTFWEVNLVKKVYLPGMLSCIFKIIWVGFYFLFHCFSMINCNDRFSDVKSSLKSWGNFSCFYYWLIHFCLG